MSEQDYKAIHIQINWKHHITYFVAPDATFKDLKQAVWWRDDYMTPDRQQWIPDPCASDDEPVANLHKLLEAERVDVLLKYF